MAGSGSLRLLLLPAPLRSRTLTLTLTPPSSTYTKAQNPSFLCFRNRRPSQSQQNLKTKKNQFPKPINLPSLSSFSSFLDRIKGDGIGLEILSIALPAVLALAADPIASLVDTAFVGHLGSAELAAVGVSVSVFNLVSKLFNVPLLNVTASFVAEQQALESTANSDADGGDKTVRLVDGERRKFLPAVSNSLAPCFAAKVSSVQRALRSWSAGLSSKVKAQCACCLFWIDWLDRAEEGRQLNSVEHSLRPMLKVWYGELCLQDELKWKQRSRVLWLKAGDSNSKFFHRKANCRRSKNRISSLSDGSSSLSSHHDIANHLFSFFSEQQVGGDTPMSSINFQLLYPTSPTDLYYLQTPFTLEEVKSAVFSLAPEKAPGPDGLPFLFYQHFWSFLHQDIMAVFDGFFDGSIKLDGLNNCWLCPIPKKATVSSARDLRPISLLHSLPKLISKVLATRLQGCLHLMINPFQTAFIKGRHLLDNFRCAQVLVHHLHSSKCPAALLKLDYERAFDHVNWEFLLRLLSARGFGDRWIRWIKELLSTASASVLLNGVPGLPFRCTRGLRQGDPLSPLLFIICIDVLFNMLQLATNAGFLQAVGVGDIKIHSLQFADDLLLFFDGSSSSAASIKIILNSFSENSGLKINFDKSSLVPINLSLGQSSDLASFFGCPAQAFPFKYLGLPLSPRRLGKADFLPLIEKLDVRLAGWKGLLLSRGGRLVLLNSVLTGLPSFFCSAFRLPKWVSNAIDNIRRSFFWRGTTLANGFHCLVSWEAVCRPKRQGGLGIRQLQPSNSALLIKGLWAFFNSPELPWVQLLRAKHYKHRPLSLANRPPPGSAPCWKDFHGLDLAFATSVNFTLGNGQLISFWNARWAGASPLCNLFPLLHSAAKQKHLSAAAWISRYSDNPFLAFFLPLSFSALGELHRLRDLLANHNLSNSEDSASWRWNDNGIFSSSSAYSFLTFSGITSCNNYFLWKITVPLRVKIFLWLASRNRVQTADTLVKRGWIGPTICVLCNSGGEDLEHLFFKCPFAKSVWNRLLFRMPRNYRPCHRPRGDFISRWKTARSSLSGSDRVSFDSCFAATCWELWKERNARIFTSKAETIFNLERRIAALAQFWASTLIAANG